MTGSRGRQAKVLVGLSFLCLCARTLEAKVLAGIDVLEKQNFEILRGKRVGLITNQTGVDRRGNSTIDLLFNAKGVQLVALFSPEHGIRGKAKHGESVSDAQDEKTKLPIYSLYGKTKRPTEEMLKGLDALVFDIQDVGTRFYTYTTTLAYALEEAAKRNVEFIVLDRPNPITGTIVEGEALSPKIKHFTAYLQVPVRHGMTVGELAAWHNQTAGVQAKLTVVKMEGWQRAMWFGDTGLVFKPPSPNLRNLRAAALYPGVGGFEATNVSVGRGTGNPFEVIGSTWMDGNDLAERLTFLALPGFEFTSAGFKPKEDLYKGADCRGIKIKITDKNEARPVDLFVQIFVLLRERYPGQFAVRWDEIPRITGSEDFQERIDLGESAESILMAIHERAEDFKARRAPYLLYE